MKRLSLRIWALAGIFAAFAMAAAPNAAWAVTDCRGLETVTDSAVPDDNAGAGGHLGEHVIGMNPRGQVGTTAYPSAAKFTEVWDAYVGLSYANAGSPNCEDGQAPFPQIPFARLGMDAFDLKRCTATADGACTTWEDVNTGNVAFGFRKEDDDWILNTSYPRP